MRRCMISSHSLAGAKGQAIIEKSAGLHPGRGARRLRLPKPLLLLRWGAACVFWGEDRVVGVQMSHCRVASWQGRLSPEAAQALAPVLGSCARLYEEQLQVCTKVCRVES